MASRKWFMASGSFLRSSNTFPFRSKASTFLVSSRQALWAKYTALGDFLLR